MKKIQPEEEEIIELDYSLETAFLEAQEKEEEEKKKKEQVEQAKANGNFQHVTVHDKDNKVNTPEEKKKTKLEQYEEQLLTLMMSLEELESSLED